MKNKYTFLKYSPIALMLVLIAVTVMSIVRPKQIEKNIAANPGATEREISFTRTTYESKAMVIMYIPDVDKDGIVDKNSGYTSFYDVYNGKTYSNKTGDVKSHILDTVNNGLALMTDGTKYKGFRDKLSKPSIKYTLDQDNVYLKFSYPNKFKDTQFVDLVSILNEFNVCQKVEQFGIKEVFVYTFHTSEYVPRGFIFSDARAGTQIVPNCRSSYNVINNPISSGIAELMQQKINQVSGLLSQSDNFGIYKAFTGEVINGSNGYYVRNPGCGDHVTYPNTPAAGTKNKVLDTTEVLSECENWLPDRTGAKTKLSCKTWNKYLYGTETCKDDGGVAHSVWWMQNIPGYGNNLKYRYIKDRKVRNWWDVIANLDDVKGDDLLTVNTSSDVPGRILSPVTPNVAFPLYMRFYRPSDLYSYRLYIGSKKGNNDLYDQRITSDSVILNVKDLKKSVKKGDKLYVGFWATYNGVSKSNLIEYVVTDLSSPGSGNLIDTRYSYISNPENNSTIKNGTGLTFTKPANAKSVFITIGTKYGYNDYFDMDVTKTPGITLSTAGFKSIPGNGAMLYVTIFTTLTDNSRGTNQFSYIYSL